MGKKVDIRQLKRFAMHLPHDSALRTVMIVEDDVMDVERFLMQLPLWLRLVRLAEADSR